MSIMKEIGEKAPQTDEELDALKDKAIQYFIDNPERIKEFDGGFKSIPYNSGDGVVRTNNVGGSLRESNKLIDDEDEDDWEADEDDREADRDDWEADEDDKEADRDDNDE